MPNRLAQETSPYLQQHADNPVDWYPWGEEALARARAEHKPILLSIGYSACHWCHVMAHESFEDSATAAVMNRLFVNIKVDREERPDLDKIYQLAHQMLARRPGGWPLTMFLTPDRQVPFFGGTYFPDAPRHGLPAFRDLLERVAAYFHAHADEIAGQSAAVLDAFDSLSVAPAGPVRLDASLFDMARGELAQSFDRTHGGFGRAPKFPHPTHLGRLLRHWSKTARGGHPDEQALHMATFTLRKMALGGVYDQLGGGFCRYSVDDRWMIPHFEKMLYDNGPLLALYAEAYAATGEALFARIASETADWTLREMQSPEGGYYSSMDADAEHVEGKFYVWDPVEPRQLLAPEAFALVSRHFGLDQPPNFEGLWHLYVRVDVDALARETGLSPAEVRATLDRARSTLLAARTQRVWPGRDEKILTAWNALMIRGMAIAARRLGRPELAESATRALDFIRMQLWRDGRLLATYKDGRAHLAAYLDDHAMLIDAILELLQARWRSVDLAFAVQLADVLLGRFEDVQQGGFFFTAHDHETLLQRPKGFADEALPNGNALAALALARLGWLVGEQRYLDAARRTVEAAAPWIGEAPSLHCAALDAVEEQLEPPTLCILRGDEATLRGWLVGAGASYDPSWLVFAIPEDDAALPPSLAEKRPQPGGVAYLCTGMTCRAPIVGDAAIRTALGVRD